jgi:hypothetical protein
MRLGSWSWLILSLLAAAGPVRTTGAQSPPPFSCADTVQRALSEFRGKWRVRALFRTGPGSWDTTRAVSVFGPVLNGCILQEEYRGTRYGEPYEYLALWGGERSSGDQDPAVVRPLAARDLRSGCRRLPGRPPGAR